MCAEELSPSNMLGGAEMGEQQRAAIESSAVLHGVTKDAVFETIAADIHGFGSGIKRRWAEMDAEYDEAALKAAGIKTASDVQRVIPINVGAHDELEAMLDLGWHWLDALDYLEEKWARDGFRAKPFTQAALDDTEAEEPETMAYYQDLMKASVTPNKGSSSKSKRRGSRGRPDPLNVQTALIRQSAA